jgi:hypothetical protein
MLLLSMLEATKQVKQMIDDDWLITNSIDVDFWVIDLTIRNIYNTLYKQGKDNI